MWVTRIKHGRLGKAPAMPFAGSYHLVTRWVSESSCKRPFALVVSMNGVTERDWGIFSFASQTVFECLFIDSGYLFVSTRLVMFAPCVLRFVNTALVHTLCCSSMRSGVDFWTVIICSASGMARICPSMNAVSKSISIAERSSTLESTVPSKSTIRIYSLWLVKIWDRLWAWQG